MQDKGKDRKFICRDSVMVLHQAYKLAAHRQHEIAVGFWEFKTLLYKDTMLMDSFLHFVDAKFVPAYQIESI